MRRTFLLTGVAIVILLLFIGYLGWSSIKETQPIPMPKPSATIQVSQTPQTTQIISTSPETATQEQVRDAVMNFIEVNHNETVPHMPDLPWTGGYLEITPQVVGSSTYSYESYGWTVTMTYPIVPNPRYSITVTYVSLISEMFPPKNIVAWNGTWQDGAISQTSYSFIP